MNAFMNEDFLLTTPTAIKLYHTYAKNCPIVDYHNHLPAKEIYERRAYKNLTQLWLEADHYKWRAMRACGVPEYYVTGEAGEYEKFYRFAEILPRLIGSPVYHWAHLELQRYFGITTPLTADTAKEIWDKTEEILKGEDYDAVSLLRKMNVQVLCTTDDPTDTLQYHKKIADQKDIPFRVLPSFRPDRFLHIDAPAFCDAVARLGEMYGEITDWESLKAALCKSLDFFETLGFKVSDHGFLHFRYGRSGDADCILKKALRKELLTEEEVANYQGALLRFLGKEYSRRNIAMQLHLGPIRNNSPKIFAAFGPDAGSDSMGEMTNPFLLSAFLGDLEQAEALPKTVLYGLNPVDNAMLCNMAANFTCDGAKVQYGAAWWQQDHIRGISEQLDLLMETGQLSRAVGMLTDSRSFTSFPRHEYYRRILCEKIGKLVEVGEYPMDEKVLGELVQDLCYRNAQLFFGF